MCPLCNAVVHPDFPAVHFDSIHGFSRLHCIVDRFEIDESKPTAPSTVTVQHNLGLLDGAELPKLLVQLTLGGVQAQAKHSDTFAFIWSLTITIMTTSV